MAGKFECSKLTPYLQGIIMIFLSLYLVIVKPHIDFIRRAVHEECMLIEGRPGYEQIWSKIDVYFRVWIFDVLNPDEVMEGATPEFRERGPYVYDMYVKKDVVNINEDTDEMDFYSIRTYKFNRQLSGGREDDVVTIINSVYMGTMGTIISAFPSFLKKLGNDISKLFPNMEDLFIRGTVGDILFNGLPMECDSNKHKELKLICGFLMGKKPAVIKDTNVEGVYTWSFFDRLNGTAQGPMSVNRGVKNKSRLGDTTAFKGKHVQKYWKSEACNTVVGTDSITWAPMETKWEYVLSYEPQICRWAKAAYKRDVIINGLIGWRYELGEESWQPEEALCYCPVVKKQPVCPIMGVMDLTPCQEAPIYYSEPHYLHGDPALIEYAKGLQPDEKTHATFITIEPLSGIPLSGSKKLQLSVKLINSPAVDLLANVTEGYFPILWAEEAKNATIDSLGLVLQVYRLRRLLAYMIYVPLILGIFVILRAIFLQSYTSSHIKPEDATLNSVLVRHNPRFDGSEISWIGSYDAGRVDEITRRLSMKKFGRVNSFACAGGFINFKSIGKLKNKDI